MKKFLVQFSGGHYFRSLTPDRKEANGTILLGFAELMSFVTATHVAAGLRRIGYRDAFVATLRGEPVTADNLAATEELDQDEFETIWGVDPQPEVEVVTTPVDAEETATAKRAKKQK